MPYIKFYLNNIDRENNEIHLLYWNRDLKEESIFEYKDLILHEFKYYQEDDTSKLIKVKAFIEYRKYASKILKTDGITARTQCLLDLWVNGFNT